jgi:hypothetical protein
LVSTLAWVDRLGASDPGPFVLDRGRGARFDVSLDQPHNWLGGRARPQLQEAIEPEIGMMVALVLERARARDVRPEDWPEVAAVASQWPQARNSSLSIIAAVLGLLRRTARA